MKVIGYNGNHGLAGSLNNQSSGSDDIKTPCQSRLDVPSLLSFSTFRPSIWIMRNGDAFAVGPNQKGGIMSTMPKVEFKKDTKIEFKNKNGKPVKFISAVCGDEYTLYQVSEETASALSQLVYAHNDKDTIFLNIGKRSPLSLFGGRYTSAVIDTEGGVIIITESVYKSPTSELESLSLPDGDRAVKVACCDESVIVLGESGRVFECSLKTANNSFSEVCELSGINIKEISGVYNHFFAVSEDGKVFGRGNNDNNRLGMPNGIKDVKEFKVVESLNKYHIVEAFAGYSESLFKTLDGKFFGCGSNSCGHLMLKDVNKRNVYPPLKTTITRDATFCILGNSKSAAFYGVDPPPNTPNRKVSQFSETINPRKISKKVSTKTKDEPKNIQELLKQLELTKEENASLKKELKQSKKRISELEQEVKKLKEKSSPEKKEVKKGCGLDIIDTETLDKLKRIKSLGRGATSEVFEVVREERLALKVYNLELLTDNENEEEEKVVINMKNARRFLF
ncbi:hypothetical protein M9Y10_023768, partial [Tritrichomonas musculus]